MLRRLAPALAVLLPIAALAQSQPDPRQALGAAEANQKLAESQAGADREQAEAAAREVAALRGQLVELAAAEARGERTVSDKRLRLAALNSQEADLTARLGAQRNQLARLLSALQMFRREPPPALLVSPGDAKDAVRAAILIKAITPALQDRVRALTGEVETLKVVRREAAAANEDLFAAESSVAERRAQIERLIGEKASLERQAEGDAAEAERQAAALAAQAGSLRELVKGLPVVPAATATAAGAPPAAPLTVPVQGQVVRRYGQPDPGGRSEGWTWRTASLAIVAAPAAGLVEFAGPLKGAGGVVILRAGGGYHLVLSGLDKVLVGPGRSVAAGEPVARMGDGAHTGTDLYVEVRKDGEPVDPAKWFTAARP